VLYKTSDEYAPESEGGLLWNDPALGIAWPVAATEATLSPRDTTWPPLSKFESPFTFGE
jgi:dTDP-4-dehydrorhamnose 3,5-epimerase